MIRKIIKKVNKWLEDGLRSFLAQLTPDQRIILTGTTLLIFGGLSIYMTFSSIYRFGKDKGEQMQIDHIQRLQFELKQKQLEMDSLKQLNRFYHEKK